MKITQSTNPKEVAEKTMNIIKMNNFPNMRLQDNTKYKPSDNKGFEFWLHKVTKK